MYGTPIIIGMVGIIGMDGITDGVITTGMGGIMDGIIIIGKTLITHILILFVIVHFINKIPINGNRV
jgi:hypothetical protein